MVEFKLNTPAAVRKAEVELQALRDAIEQAIKLECDDVLEAKFPRRVSRNEVEEFKGRYNEIRTRLERTAPSWFGDLKFVTQLVSSGVMFPGPTGTAMADAEILRPLLEEIKRAQGLVKNFDPSDAMPATPPPTDVSAAVNEQDAAHAEAMDSCWVLMHPSIRDVSRKRFTDGHYADAAEAALKEVNARVKDFYRSKAQDERDGADLMNRAFSPSGPVIVLGDLNTETGRNIQLGYMQIAAGAMTGIRNPKAHENIIITPNRAMHFLFLASLLMFKLDDAKVPPLPPAAP